MTSQAFPFSAIVGQVEMKQALTLTAIDPTKADIDARGVTNEKLAVDSSGVGGGTVPAAFRLVGNHPNPFNPRTTIAFELERTSHCRVTIFRLAQRKNPQRQPLQFVRLLGVNLLLQELRAGRGQLASGRPKPGSGGVGQVWRGRLLQQLERDAVADVPVDLAQVRQGDAFPQRVLGVACLDQDLPQLLRSVAILSGLEDDLAQLAQAGQLLGRLHPVLVHLPIGLLIAAAGFQAWVAWRRRRGDVSALVF